VTRMTVDALYCAWVPIWGQHGLCVSLSLSSLKIKQNNAIQMLRSDASRPESSPPYCFVIERPAFSPSLHDTLPEQ
jgi:hypothetical protein